MSENIDSHVFVGEYADAEINWRCKICKDLPIYARMFLQWREREENKAKNKDEQYTDFVQLKYYYAMLHLLDEIHNHPECPNPEHCISETADIKCLTPECFNQYRHVYNTYASILLKEKKNKEINLKCDICAVLPYILFNDLDMVAKNICGEDIEKTQKLELDAIITDFYLDTVGQCEQWDMCPKQTNWLELRNSITTLNDYLETKNRQELQISLSSWNRLRAIDNILGTDIKSTCKDFQAREISEGFLEGKKIIYLDFGIYQLYESNKDYRTQIDSCADKRQIQFVYSPTHMEEVCRMDDVTYESERRENISRICNNYEVLPVREGYLKVVEEPVEVCFERSPKYKVLNNLAEESECAKFEALEEDTCKLLDWDGEEMEKRKKSFSSYTLMQLCDPQNDAIDNSSLNRIFYTICGAQVQLEEYRDYCKEDRTFAEIREAIRLLYMLMSALGYHRNKIKKRTKFTYKALYPTYDREFYQTIRSGFYDVDHISYASKCDYFVTCDKALFLQAREIYRYLGCRTEVIYCGRNTTNPTTPHFPTNLT